MPDKRIDVMDSETGEIEADGLLVWTPRKTRTIFSKEGYYTMSQHAAEWLAEQNLSGETHRVFWKLLAYLDMENWINVNQSSMAESMGLRKQNFGRSLKLLIEKQIILEGPKVGRQKTYRLNPHIGWKGSNQSHAAAISDELKNRMERAKISGLVSGGREMSQEELEALGQQRLFDK